MTAEYLKHRFHHDGSATDHFAEVCQSFQQHGWIVQQFDPTVFRLQVTEARFKVLEIVRQRSPNDPTSVWELAEITHPSRPMCVYLLHSYYDYEDRGGETIDLYGLREPAYLAMSDLDLLYKSGF